MAHLRDAGNGFLSPQPKVNVPALKGYNIPGSVGSSKTLEGGLKSGAPGIPTVKKSK